MKTTTITVTTTEVTVTATVGVFTVGRVIRAARTSHQRKRSKLLDYEFVWKINLNNRRHFCDTYGDMSRKLTQTMIYMYTMEIPNKIGYFKQSRYGFKASMLEVKAK